jgi:hypothetical protein
MFSRHNRTLFGAMLKANGVPQLMEQCSVKLLLISNRVDVYLVNEASSYMLRLPKWNGRKTCLEILDPIPHVYLLPLQLFGLTNIINLRLL